MGFSAFREVVSGMSAVEPNHSGYGETPDPGPHHDGRQRRPQGAVPEDGLHQ